MSLTNTHLENLASMVPYWRNSETYRNAPIPVGLQSEYDTEQRFVHLFTAAMPVAETGLIHLLAACFREGYQTGHRNGYDDGNRETLAATQVVAKDNAIESLRAERDGLKTDLQQVQDYLSAIDITALDAKDNANLKEEIEDLKESLKTANADATTCWNEADAGRATIAAQGAQVESLLAETTRLDRVIAAQQAEIERLQERADLADRHNVNLRAEWSRMVAAMHEVYDAAEPFAALSWEGHI